MKIRPVESSFFMRTQGQMDRHEEANSRFANSPKNSTAKLSFFCNSCSKY